MINLEELDLRFNQIDPDGAFALATFFANSQSFNTDKLTRQRKNFIPKYFFTRPWENPPPREKKHFMFGIHFRNKEVLERLNLDSNIFGDKSDKEIVDYLREQNTVKVKTVKKTRLMLIGHGEAGKTTLVHRLRTNQFQEHLMTDGVDISFLTIQDVEFTVFDFAGQDDYAHTHGLFFNNEAVYLAVHNPREEGNLEKLELFLKMVHDCAPQARIILATTRASQSLMKERDMKSLRKEHGNLKEIIGIDSKDGTNIEELKELVYQEAVGERLKKSTVHELLTSHERLQEVIVKEDQFSFTVEEILQMGDTLGLSEDSTRLALKLYCSWGIFHELSNGSIVRKPQQLADVMSCVFTHATESCNRIGRSVCNGILEHDETTLRAVWGKFDESLWKCDDENMTVSPFVDLRFECVPISSLKQPKISSSTSSTAFSKISWYLKNSNDNND